MTNAMTRLLVTAAAMAAVAVAAAPNDLTLRLTDNAILPITGALDGTTNNAGSLARINFMRQEPSVLAGRSGQGAPGRLWINDLNGPLYILGADRKPTKYLDVNGRGVNTGLFDRLPTENGLASGFISFEFDPDYRRNGRFYSIHIEDSGYSQREGTEALLPDNTMAKIPEPDTVPLYVSNTVTRGTVVPRYPVIQYKHGPDALGDAIAGGVVYRGSAIPELRGTFIFGDTTTGHVWYADVNEMIAADDDNPQTLAQMHEVQLAWDDPADEPNRGAQTYTTMFPIVEAAYHARGGKSLHLPGKAASAPNGRVDLRFAIDRQGNLYFLTKSDGTIRAVSGVSRADSASAGR